MDIKATTPSTATVDYACVNNALQPTYSSTLNTISINGQSIPLTGLPQTLSLPGPLAGLVSVAVNQHSATATSDSETLVQIQVLNTGLLAGLGGGSEPRYRNGDRLGDTGEPVRRDSEHHSRSRQ